MPVSHSPFACRGAGPVSLLLALIVSVTFTGCGSDPSGPGNSNGAGNAQVTANINGAAWSATSITDNRQAARYAFTADNVEWRVTIRINEFDGVRTYPLSSTPDVNIQVVRFDATGHWGGFSSGGTGSIVVTAFSATRATGTFSGTLPAGAGSAIQDPLEITNGEFDISLAN